MNQQASCSPEAASMYAMQEDVDGFQKPTIIQGTYEKGTRDEIDEFLYQLCDVDGDGNLVRSHLEAVISEILDNISSRKNSEPASLLEPKPISIFRDAAKFTKDDEGSAGKSMSVEDLRSWCRLVPSARKFLASLLKPSSGGALSHQELGEWKLMYHSALNGSSFNTFLGNISWEAADVAVTLLLESCNTCWNASEEFSNLMPDEFEIA